MASMRMTGGTGLRRCKTGQRAIKQMSIRKLPPILTLHVKRFEHRSLHGLGRKLETPLAFPVVRLDLWPFLSACILRRKFNARVPRGLPGENTLRISCNPLHAPYNPAAWHDMSDETLGHD